MIRRRAEMKSEVRRDMRGGQGDVTILHCFTKEEMKAKTRLCARLTLPPGASIGTHEHLAEDEVFIILSGVGVVDDGRTPMEVRAGDATLTGNGESHSIRNAGSENLELIAMILSYG